MIANQIEIASASLSDVESLRHGSKRPTRNTERPTPKSERKRGRDFEFLVFWVPD